MPPETPQGVLALAIESAARIVDLRFCDLPRLIHHFSIAVEELTEDGIDLICRQWQCRSRFAPDRSHLDHPECSGPVPSGTLSPQRPDSAAPRCSPGLNTGQGQCGRTSFDAATAASGQGRIMRARAAAATATSSILGALPAVWESARPSPDAGRCPSPASPPNIAAHDERCGLALVFPRDDLHSPRPDSHRPNQ